MMALSNRPDDWISFGEGRLINLNYVNVRNGRRYHRHLTYEAVVDSFVTFRLFPFWMIVLVIRKKNQMIALYFVTAFICLCLRWLLRIPEPLHHHRYLKVSFNERATPLTKVHSTTVFIHRVHFVPFESTVPSPATAFPTTQPHLELRPAKPQTPPPITRSLLAKTRLPLRHANLLPYLCSTEM